ncbi:hypothetical protein CEXT_135801 [Caerostris extrusa]|uniref:Uncharacterized protein n=1 Tax=Caerostris extrusa TaxID=172846 RepID=A0AAV4RWX7_CAEEX|nr:hypothetical protein CEXT_135801 [Caerostris extrusa]
MTFEARGVTRRNVFAKLRASSYVTPNINKTGRRYLFAVGYDPALLGFDKKNLILPRGTASNVEFAKLWKIQGIMRNSQQQPKSTMSFSLDQGEETDKAHECHPQREIDVCLIG